MDVAPRRTQRQGNKHIPEIDLEWYQATPFSAVEARDYLKHRGQICREFRGEWWYAQRSTLYWEPLRSLQALPAEKISWPTWAALGFRALVADPERANSLPTSVIIPNLRTYDETRLTRYRRREVRRALEQIRFEVVETPDILLQQGWSVASRAAAVSGHWLPGRQTDYIRHVKGSFETRPPLTVAAFDGDRLVGYMTSFAIGSQVNLLDIFISPDFRRNHTGVGLYWLTLRIWGRTAGVETALLGMPLPETPGVDAFKVSIGAAVESYPAISGLRLPAKIWLARTRPHSHMRLT